MYVVEWILKGGYCRVEIVGGGGIQHCRVDIVITVIYYSLLN